MKIDIDKLKEDLIEYFSTAINPFDVDLYDPKDINNYNESKVIEIAKNNGFNIELYEIEGE